MKSNGFTLFNRLLLTFDYRMQESHPAFAPLIKYLETALVRYYEDKSTIDPNWVEWIVATNNSLPARESKGYSIKSIEFVHQLLRKQLANYDKTVNGNKALYSPYVQDVHFKRVYGFHNYSLILKHIHPSQHLGMCHYKQYAQDPAFAEYTLSGDVGLNEKEVVQRSSEYYINDEYHNDEHFKFIVRAHESRGLFPRLVAGIPYINGGVTNVASIMVFGEANVQYMGCFDANLDRSCSAYRHGPIFMMFLGDEKELHCNNKYNPYVFDLPLNRLVFLLPDNETVNQLASMLTSAVHHHLLSADDVEQILAQNVITYKNYYLSHVLKNAPRAGVVSIDDDSTSSESSPLLSRDVLSPLNSIQLKSSSESPYDVVSPHRKEALFPPPNVATSARPLSLTPTN